MSFGASSSTTPEDSIGWLAICVTFPDGINVVALGAGCLGVGAGVAFATEAFGSWLFFGWFVLAGALAVVVKGSAVHAPSNAAHMSVAAVRLMDSNSGMESEVVFPFPQAAQYVGIMRKGLLCKGERGTSNSWCAGSKEWVDFFLHFDGAGQCG